ncbi:BURP domain-containing protein 5 [Hibiscus syriacus]|uniref:BURP domain-containing protein 5 n=1 Tax=Hibiscus syriacus TaxID=106335 RepID=A0A6A2YUA2_HIBSY|nr:BURP domain-containing protein 5 [Hibiscus syriacus]
MKVLSPVLAFVALAVVASHAALSPEQIGTISCQILKCRKSSKKCYPGGGGVNVNTGKGKPGGTSVDVGKGGVGVNTGKGKPGGGTHVNVGKGGVGVNTGKGKPGGGTHVNVGKGGIGVNTGKGKRGGGTHVSVGGKGGGVSVNTGHKGKPVNVNVSPFIYNYAATETQIHDDPNVAPSFWKKTCTPPSIQGEEKYCATSLKSMIDFSTSKLGKIDQAVSTEVEKQTPKQKYTIAAGVQRIAGGKAVVCHKQNYAYAVFYCHKSETTRAYTVPLEGADGTKAKAVAVCHTDTSAWNAKHLAFQILKVEPGTIPICHFLPQDHIVWVPK